MIDSRKGRQMEREEGGAQAKIEVEARGWEWESGREGRSAGSRGDTNGGQGLE